MKGTIDELQKLDCKANLALYRLKEFMQGEEMPFSLSQQIHVHDALGLEAQAHSGLRP